MVGISTCWLVMGQRGHEKGAERYTMAQGPSKYDLASTPGEAGAIHAPGESHAHPFGPFSAPRTMVGESGNKEFTVAPHQVTPPIFMVVFFSIMGSELCCLG